MTRARRLLIAGLAALVLLVGLVWAWLWHSQSGLNFLLTQVHARLLLTGGALQWDSAAGTLAGGAQLRGIVMRTDSLQVQIAQIQFAFSSVAILRGVVRAERLHMSGVQLRRVSVPTEDTAFEWPADWPVLPLSLVIEVPALSVRDVQVQRDDPVPLPISSIDGGVRIAHDQVRFTALSIRSPNEVVHLDGFIDLGARGGVALTLDGESSAGAVTAWQLRTRITGGPSDLQLTLDGNAPGPVSLRAQIRSEGEQLRWLLNGSAQEISPALFGGPEGRFGGELAIDGAGAAATVSGHLQRDDQIVQMLPSQFGWNEGQLLLSPLMVSALGGELRITGAVGLAGEAPVLALQIDGEELHWGASAERVTGAGSATLRGTLADWHLDGRADLKRQALTAQIELRAHGDGQRALLDQLVMKTGAGHSQLTGELVFSPSVRWQATGSIQGFDPGFFAPAYPGAISAKLDSTGSWLDDVLQYTLALDSLQGRVRDRAIAGSAQLDYRAGLSSGRLDLSIGKSHIIASGAYDAAGRQPSSLQAKMSPLFLNDLLPDSDGRLSGELALSGTDGRALIRGELRGEHLAWNGLTVETMHLLATPEGTAASQIALSLDSVTGGGMRLAQLKGDARGTLAQAQWTLAASDDVLKAQASGRWLHGSAAPRVDVHALSLSPTRGAVWRLQEPASLTLGAATVVSPLCLTQASGRVCLQGRWPGEATLSAQGLELAWLDPWLHRDDVQFALEGQVEGNATLRSSATGVTQGAAQLRFSPGSLQVLPRGEQPAFAWRTLTLDAALTAGVLALQLDAQTDSEGVLQGQLTTGFDADSALTGSLRLDLAQLAWLELFSPDIAGPSGHLGGQLLLAGTRNAPRVSGQLVLSDFSTELPALGIALSNSRAQLDATSDGSLHLEAHLDSGDGPLRLVADGTLSNAEAFSASITGERVKLIDSADMRVWITPDLQVVRAKTGFLVTGKVLVPEARIALDKRQAGAVAHSPDVVVVDPVESDDAGTAIPIRLDVRTSFGQSVELSGFGLDGKLGGNLRITQVPGREPLGTGTLTVSGSYQRYGKPLTIRHARLSYTRSPLDNPALDIRAERSINAQMVGVQVSGSALRPATTLVSNPALDSNETLSWLVLGRPLRSAQQGDGQRLSVAASALGAGGNLLAEQIGIRLGLDAAEVGESRSLGLNTLSVGKFISPRLFVSYGVSLLGAGQVVTLKYLLGRGFEVEIESGEETRGAINWQTER